MAHTRAQAAAQTALPSPASNYQGSSRKRATRRAERNRLRPTTPSETPTPQLGRKRKHSSGHALEGDLDLDLKRQRTEPAIGSDAYKHTDLDWPEETLETDFTMDRLLAWKKSSSNLRKRSISATSTTPSDQKPREEKSVPYRDLRYKTLLETKGSFIDKSELGITDESKTLCQTLLKTVQAEPQDSLFRSDIFESTCQKVEDRNETRVIRDITPLIVLSAEILCIYGASHLKHLIESVNEGWNNSIPLTSTHVFTKDQLTKLSPFIGDFIAGDQSLFMATYYMYFPFLTCEVKCGAAALDIADRQNAYSMTLAVRAIAKLFRAVKREDEVNRKILAFSVSYDHTSVRIYGHYPVIAGKDIKYYRHPIHKFDFTALDGKDKWTAYRFTKNVYDTWMPKHFERICSAIDQLPSNLDFDVPPLSEATGLSQNLVNLMQSGACSASSGEQQAVTPDTSFSGVPKRRKGRKLADR
ncbi:hypothetical protein C7999DRAFT_45091 [Corynascus novoguineensis]|uniref:DUF7924 domain-containing protein n=1 Tax=Corynascus novoguineensis TaxID=1126955 RepID=A0AAN7CJK4_9PEZI|nr:hypothetical protein C7999DRAFT_45091 [Corynascus novoguineensis]